jgi:hypothetical protein
MFNDYGNTLFEAIGSIMAWLNVKALYKDNEIKGVYWPIYIFYSVWGYWNLYYYPSVNCWGSFVAGIILALGNTAWVVVAVRLYLKNKKN